MALSLSYNPTPATPLGFVARVAPSWGGQAASGAEAIELGVDAQRRESPMLGGTDNGFLGRGARPRRRVAAPR